MPQPSSFETREALAELEAIAAVDGVDGVSIGPADLAASLGHAGNQAHPDVVSTIENTIKRLVSIGTPVGILTSDVDFAKRCIDMGALFTAVGVDVGVLARGAEQLSSKFRWSLKPFYRLRLHVDLRGVDPIRIAHEEGRSP